MRELAILFLATCFVLAVIATACNQSIQFVDEWAEIRSLMIRCRHPESKLSLFEGQGQTDKEPQ